jgi:glycine dehydrogenase subunit 1
MSFCAHTDQEIAAMLAEVKCASIEDLFKEIPDQLKIKELPGFAERLSEMQVWQLLQPRAKGDASKLNFIGAGCYEHYIPAAVWEITSRGEYLTAYTPYQAEASQGTLQLLYEFQTMFANLTSLDVSNASLYDGATALAEAVLMAVRCSKHPHSNTVLIPKTVHPFYREVVQTIVAAQNIEIITVDYDQFTGKTDLTKLQNVAPQNFAALVVPQPNFFGVLEDVDQLTTWAQQHGGLVIGLVNPLSLALLNPPGQWGADGADIACGEAQALGVPLASGGPYIGFLCCKMAYIRQLPGRLVGQTTDVAGQRGFTLTLQAREQHIRRAKATSNICTNQGLLATAVTIYLSLLGATGLRQVALKSHDMCAQFKAALAAANIKVLFNSPFFHEIVLQTEQPVPLILDKLAALGIQGGFDLTPYYPELGNALLCCVTETKSAADIATFIEALRSC